MLGLLEEEVRGVKHDVGGQGRKRISNVFWLRVACNVEPSLALMSLVFLGEQSDGDGIWQSDTTARRSSKSLFSLDFFFFVLPPPPSAFLPPHWPALSLPFFLF